jgi:adenylate cyclase
MFTTGLGNFFHKKYKSWYINLFIAVILSLIILLFQKTTFFQDFESKTIDYRFRLFPIAQRADSNVIMIAIDDNSLRDMRKNRVVWPWARDIYGAVVNYLSEQGAKAVIFDMQFYEPDYDRADVSSEELDAEFAQSIQESGKVVLGMQLVPDATSVPPELSRFTLTKTTGMLPSTGKYQGVLAPIPEFMQSAAKVGIINIEPDKDGVIRRVPFLYHFGKDYYPQISYSAWSLAQHSSQYPSSLKKLPFDKEGNYLINWYGPAGVDGVFKYLRFTAVLQSASATASGLQPQIPNGYFKDKYVIIGATAGGLMDLKISPYTQIMPGMEIWGTVLSNLLNHDFIHIVPGWINFLILLIVSFLVIILFSNTNNKWNNILLLTILILVVASNFYLWSSQRYLLNLVGPLLAFFLAYFYIVTVSYLMEGRNKREIRKIFSRYLHPDVVEKLVENPDLVQMGGEEIDATILFSDIYDFTTFSEKTQPQELVSTLNEYFSHFTNSILDFHGLLDKYTGDGLMALWGVPIPRKDHALLACQAALAHRNYSLELLKTKPQLTAAENLHLFTRVGINSGKIVAGNIGSERRMDYTAIGDAVNLSARLEGVNKIFHTNIIISESTYCLVEDSFICRELDYLRVKGKKEPTRIFELLDEKNNSEQKDYSWITEYEKALELYRKGDWKEAIALFTQFYEGPLRDQPSHTMIERCEYLIKNPPATWDGILTLEVK